MLIPVSVIVVKYRVRNSESAEQIHKPVYIVLSHTIHNINSTRCPNLTLINQSIDKCYLSWSLDEKYMIGKKRTRPIGVEPYKVPKAFYFRVSAFTACSTLVRSRST